MSVISKIGQFFGGAGGGIVEGVASAIDKFVETPEEMAIIKREISSARHLIKLQGLF